MPSSLTRILRHPVTWVLSVALVVAVAGLTMTKPASASCFDGSGATLPEARFTARRGVSLHGWFTWTPQLGPSSYSLPVFQKMIGEVTQDEAQKLRAYGFDFVRLTIDPVVFMTLENADWNDAVAKLEAAIDRLHAAGLAVIVDQHPVSTMSPRGAGGLKGAKGLEPGAPPAVIERFTASSARLAGVLDSRYGAKGDIALELLNEPDVKCGDLAWSAQQAAMHAAVRAKAPRITLVLTGACYGAIDGLRALDPSQIDDSNVLYTFHFYEPMAFTHQGVNFADDAIGKAVGLPYPVDADRGASVIADLDRRLTKLPPETREKAMTSAKKYFSEEWNANRIAQRFDEVRDWADTSCISSRRILVGEFGANRTNAVVTGAPGNDAGKWIRDVRVAAEAREFSWALWAYRGEPNARAGNFNLVDPITHTPEFEVFMALELFDAGGDAAEPTQTAVP